MRSRGGRDCAAIEPVLLEIRIIMIRYYNIIVIRDITAIVLIMIFLYTNIPMRSVIFMIDIPIIVQLQYIIDIGTYLI